MYISLGRETRTLAGFVALCCSGVIRLSYRHLKPARGFVGYGGAGPPTRVVDLFANSLPRLVSRGLLKATTDQTVEPDR